MIIYKLNLTPGTDEPPWITANQEGSGEPKDSKVVAMLTLLKIIIGLRIMIKEESSRLVAF